MRRLLGVEITDRLTCIKLKLRDRILLGKCLTPEGNFPVCRSRLHSVHIECDDSTTAIALYIHRIVQIIFKLKILVGSCDCRIVRWLYIAYYHGMVVALHYVKLSPYNRIVESGRNLTHTSTYRVNYLTVLVCACYLIAVVSCDRADSLVNRELLTRIYDTAVYQAARVLYIGCTPCCRAAEIGRKASQIILNL